MPARSEAQRRYLNMKFGHEWVKEHHFDNQGKLPKRVKKKAKKKSGHVSDRFHDKGAKK
jgi:hypothetical protein